VQAPSTVSTFLFTDIEGSTRLWEQDHERMRVALARHDVVSRAAVETNRGRVVKMSGDGIHAVFDDPLDAVNASLCLQRALEVPGETDGITLRVRCGMHLGAAERRDNDYFGSTVNRAARIANAAHGGQVLLSQAAAVVVADRLPAGVALRDLGAIRLRDLTSAERVFQILEAGLRADFPALRSLEATPNNLPHQLTSFVGRKREIVEVRGLLGKTRLLTLLGIGGLGKTRLSLQVAADLMDEFPDGVWFIDLAPLRDGRLVAQAAATVLGVKEEAGHPVLEALVKHVKDRQLLLILDNCEHLTQSAAELAKQLLQSGPRMKVLASSREHLRVAGETSYHVPALTAPDPNSTFTLEALTQFEAVHLFVDRATAAQPTFAVTSNNASAVADICRRLDGIPLALELAAARMRALSVEKISARLSDRFRLLSGGDKTVLPRQQTLRALIDWSYDLLTEQERILFRRLAVFAGGWTLEAAEAVGADGDLAEADVLDVLSTLVEKSLVVMDDQGQRYRLLETVREYAQEQLEASGDANASRTRHLALFLRIAEKASAELVGPQQGAWLTRLDIEAENLLVAHAWCDQADEGGELGLRLVFSVKLYFIYRGLMELGRRFTEEALARAGAGARTAGRCRALHAAGQFGFFMGRYGEAHGFLEESLSIAREIGDKGRAALVLQALGMVATGRGDVSAARSYFEEALALARAQGNKREIAVTANALAQLHRMEGELDAAEPLYASVVELARELDDRDSIAIGLVNLAMVSIGRQLPDRARTILLEVFAIASEIGSKRDGQSVLEVSAGLASLCREWDKSALFFGAAERLAAQMGLHRDPADEAFLAPLVANARVALGTNAFAAHEAVGRDLSYQDALSGAGDWLAGNRGVK
jgi:predicted ATPase/class 3 adenylate cyclase